MIKSSFNKLNSTSILYNKGYGYLPKINDINDSSYKLNKESSEFWSPIDGVRNKENKKKIITPQRLKGFSTKNRQINFKKSDSIFLTNNNANANTAERSSSIYFEKSQNDANNTNTNMINNSGSIYNSTFRDRMIFSNLTNNNNQTESSSLFNLDT